MLDKGVGKLGTALSSSWADLTAGTWECGQRLVCSGSIVVDMLESSVVNNVERMHRRKNAVTCGRVHACARVHLCMWGGGGGGGVGSADCQ